jgi:hypothetical protein
MLVEISGMKVRKNRRGFNVFTKDQLEEIVRLRWLMKDWRKCVLYCWKNRINP